MEKITIQSSWDDFSPHNLRLAELLQKYKIPAIFFIECDYEEKLAQIKMLASRKFEIGCHTYSHPQDLKNVWINLDAEIIDCRRTLQQETGQKIDWFCYPRGRYNQLVKEKVAEAGFRFARTTALGPADKYDPLAIAPLFHCYRRHEYRGEDWLDYGIRVMKFMVEKIKTPYIHFWGHAAEIEKYQEWEKLEKLLRWIKENYYEKKI